MEIITKNDDGSLTSREAVADVTFRHDRHRGEFIVNGQDLSWYVTKNGVSIEIRDGLPRVTVEISPREQLEVVLEKAQIEFRQASQDAVCSGCGQSSSQASPCDACRAIDGAKS